jgi:hypothetical protein
MHGSLFLVFLPFQQFAGGEPFYLAIFRNYSHLIIGCFFLIKLTDSQFKAFGYFIQQFSVFLICIRISVLMMVQISLFSTVISTNVISWPGFISSLGCSWLGWSAGIRVFYRTRCSAAPCLWCTSSLRSADAPCDR